MDDDGSTHALLVCPPLHCDGGRYYDYDASPIYLREGESMHESETNCCYWVPIDGELLVVQDEAASYYFGSVAD